MTEDELKKVILDVFMEKENFKGIGLDDDYFDLGISSLTVVHLQVEIEAELKVVIPTGQLMRFSTINQWIQAYAAKRLEMQEGQPV